MRSIQRHLALRVLGASAIGALLLGLLSFALIETELDEAQDEALLRVAAAVADQGSAAGSAAPPRVRAAAFEDMVVVIWSRAGLRLHSSHPDVAIAFGLAEGLKRQRLDGIDWDVQTVVRTDRVVQAAQRAAAQQQDAAESAARLFLPYAALIAIIGTMMLFALRRGLRPLDVAATDIAARSAASLASIDERNMPREILPLLRAINGLMQRLASAFAQQRHFVAEAAHELRTPVTAMKLQLQLLQTAPNDAARQAALLELQAGIDRTQRLIEQLLQLSRSEPGGATRQVQTVALDELVRAAVARFSPLAEQRRIDLGAQAERPLAAQGDVRELETLLDNLIDNALRYTPDGGVIDVVADVLQTRPALRVIDSGPGIAADQRERVFDRFHRGDSPPRPQGDAGTGLGLAIVRAIADRHGAVVSLHTPVSGQGLEARVLFDPVALP